MLSLICKNPNCSAIARTGRGRSLTYMSEIAFQLCECCWIQHPHHPEANIDKAAIEAINTGTPFTLACADCDAFIDQQHKALLLGWMGITTDLDGFSWNFIGHCPECYAKTLAEDEAYQAKQVQLEQSRGLLF